MAIVTSTSGSVPIPTPRETKWQTALQKAIRDPVQLCEILQLPPTLHQAARAAAEQFPLVAPLEYICRMRVGDPHDPLLRQVLPLAQETADVVGFEPDPVDDSSAVVVPGLLQKYARRALMVVTPTCAVHCRYCFRRHFNHTSTPRRMADWRPALVQLAKDREIDEIVLSGGDPLILHDDRLGQLIEELARIEHLRRLRIHTRLPIVIPQRVTRALIALLKASRLTPIVVIHANHPAELDAAVVSAVGCFVEAGVPVLNQSVLLRGVNDSVDALDQLYRQLINLRVMPYYLHQLDRVTGAAHFFVPPETGQDLIAQLRTRLPGYAVPRFVREQPGAAHKIPLV